MKAIKWIGHPVVVICLFLLLITEGENFGGFYLLYLILALPHGAPYAILAMLGIASIVIGFNITHKKMIQSKQILYIIGLFLMIASLVNFFMTGNQRATFEQAIPLLTFIIYGISSFCFMIYIIYSLSHHRINENYKTT